MRVNEIIKNIYHIRASTQHELTSLFVRFQEHYESPFFRGKYFTLAEFKKWYIKNSEGGKKNGKFTYYDDWAGFNIPSYVLEPFYQKKFDPLSSQEKWLLKTFEKERHHRFYLIGTFGRKKPRLLKHEVAHGLFYTDSAYRKEMCALLKQLTKEDKKTIHHYLKCTAGYHPQVFDDETHAHVLAGHILLEGVGMDTTRICRISARMNTVFYKHYWKQHK